MGAKDLRRTPVVWIATAGGVGFGPWAPGTWGAVEGVVLFVLLARLGLVPYVGVVLGLTAIGVWSAGAAEEVFGTHDDGRIVIDEVVGQLIALLPLVLLQGIELSWSARPADGSGTPAAGLDLYWVLVVTAFVAFRWLDIQKPGLVRWAERRFPGGMGVMADDIVAGILAALVVTLPAYVIVVHQLRTAASLVLAGGMAT